MSRRYKAAPRGIPRGLMRRQREAEGAVVVSADYVYVCHLCRTDWAELPLPIACPRCGGVLEVQYDLATLRRRLTPQDFGRGPHSLWRYAALLPVAATTAPVTLCEGWTPLLPAVRLGATLGVSQLYLKDDTRNPSGSFKDRGASLTVTKCVEMDIQAIALPSKAGNLPSAFASYAARAGLRCYALLMDSSPSSDVARTVLRGARVVQVRGSHVDLNALFDTLSRRRGWFDCRAPRNLFRIEGKKTVGFEIAEQFGWTAPDVVVTAAGGGVNTAALWKAFSELKQLGWIERTPRIVAVQPEGCAPLVRAFVSGTDVSPWENPATFAVGLEVPAPGMGPQVLRALRESGGLADTVSDQEIRSAILDLARSEGIHVQPASAAGVAWVIKAARSERLAATEKVVCILTGAGNNGPEATEDLVALPPQVGLDADIVEAHLEDPALIA